ncbi:MAG TPA: hypothetical protein PLG38_07440 [Propionibacteriaceae bacterium]|nr:hypothetical protein [Propionibacteriaceae bacterium]HQE31832.1 hypothetical protein [Propionibacteriaceae bacterium]
MTLIGSPQPATDSLVPRFVAAGVAIVLMLGATLLFLAGLVVGTGGDPRAGLTYQMGLYWSLFATIGAVAGAVLWTKKWESRYGAWKAAAYATLAAVGLGLLGDLVAAGVLLAIHKATGA